MTLKALRDLQLAGVQWEITDTPITMPKTQKQPTFYPHTLCCAPKHQTSLNGVP